MKVDLRSDTVTKPSPQMVLEMLKADQGDDVFEENATVNELQDYCADLFGHEAALFCVSGTMANQIAINIHTRPGDELICADQSHIYLYEAGGVAHFSGVQIKLLPAARGLLSASQIESSINHDDVHYPATKLVCIENTFNRGGGSVYPLLVLKEIRQLCDKKNLALHLDGARVFNAIVEAGYSPHEIGTLFDSISVCLSKGLGAPIGTVLIGSKKFIHQARRARKRFGGGWRQAGFLAGCGLFALRNNVERLKEDHRRSKEVGEILKTKRFVQEVVDVQTNILIFKTKDISEAEKLLKRLEGEGILCGSKDRDIRFVFHLDVSEPQYHFLCDTLKNLHEI